jgi:hypothetical protein
MVYGNSDVSKLAYTFSATSTTEIEKIWNGSGSYPILTGADVFRIFANAKHAGDFAMYQYLDQVNPEDEYCMYDLNFSRDEYAVHGASHTDHYLEEVQIYIKKSLITTDFLDSTIDTQTGLNAMYNYNIDPKFNAAVAAAWAPDTDFEALLTIWLGVAPASW